MDKSRMLFGIITAIVVVLAAIIHYQYLMVQKEKHILEQNLDKITQEKEGLSSELEQSKIDLHNREEELNKTIEEMTSWQKEAEEIAAKLTETEAVLDKAKAESATYRELKNQLAADLDYLKKDYETMKARYDTVSQEKATLEENLRSKTFLKEALKQLKFTSGYGKAKTEKIKETYNKIYMDTPYGNRGYIIKDAKPTYPRNVKVEVLPAE